MNQQPAAVPITEAHSRAAAGMGARSSLSHGGSPEAEAYAGTGGASSSGHGSSPASRRASAAHPRPRSAPAAPSSRGVIFAEGKG